MRRLLAAALATVLAVAGCLSSARADPPALRILTLGDSITSPGQWQAELCRLMAQDAGVTCDLRNEAVSGTGCGYWPSRIAGLLAQHQPDMVILACGTNDWALSPQARADLGTAFRLTVEAIYTFQSSPRIRIVPALIQYSDHLIAPQWVVDSEPLVNSELYTNMQYYAPAGWFTAILDWQYIASTPTYLVAQENGVPAGLHPTPRGNRYMGRLAYDRIAAGMGWPATSEPPLCDLYGTRRPYPRPAYIPCLDGG